MRNYWHPDFPPKEPKESKLWIVIIAGIFIALFAALFFSGFEVMSTSIDDYSDQRARLEEFRKPVNYTEEALHYEIWEAI